IILLLARQLEFNTRLLRLLNTFVLPVRDELRDGIASLKRKTEELSLAVHERFSAAHANELRQHRELSQRIEAVAGDPGRRRATVARLRVAAASSGGMALPPGPVVSGDLGGLPGDAYLRFEDRHRGSREEIRQRQRTYLDLFSAGPVLDIGCGRGEFLELC